MKTLRRLCVCLVALSALAACVDSPAGLAATADSGDPLALTFDELARQSAASGDVGRAEGFTYAALAARNGVTPARLDVRNAGTLEIYEAFVSAVDWQIAVAALARVPAHRTITAWRRTPDGITRILSLTTPSDSAPVLNPLSLSPAGPVAAVFAGASALYHETRTIGSLGPAAVSPVADVFWIATSGFVKIREVASGAACPRPSAEAVTTGVGCKQARFTVRFDVTTQLVTRRPYEVRAGSEVRRIQTPAEQALAGYKFTFACATVSPSRGCG